MTKSLTTFLPNYDSDTDSLSDYKMLTSHKVELTALSIVGGLEDEEESDSSSSVETSQTGIRPCLVCGVSVSLSGSSQLRTLENVWAASTDLAPSSSLIRAMNSVNSATSNSLDIMKVHILPSQSQYQTFQVKYDTM